MPRKEKEWQIMDINKERLLDSIFMLGKIGVDASGERTRLAASDAEKEGRRVLSGKRYDLQRNSPLANC